MHGRPRAPSGKPVVGKSPISSGDLTVGRGHRTFLSSWPLGANPALSWRKPPWREVRVRPAHRLGAERWAEPCWCSHSRLRTFPTAVRPCARGGYLPGALVVRHASAMVLSELPRDRHRRTGCHCEVVNRLFKVNSGRWRLRIAEEYEGPLCFRLIALCIAGPRGGGRVTQRFFATLTSGCWGVRLIQITVPCRGVTCCRSRR